MHRDAHFAEMLHKQANEAAQEAVDALIAKHGEDSGVFGYCGSAWVKIRPASGRFVHYLKENKLGSKSYNGGYEITPTVNYPAGCVAWQSLDLREAAATAYATVLREAGFRVTTHTWAN